MKSHLFIVRTYNQVVKHMNYQVKIIKVDFSDNILSV